MCGCTSGEGSLTTPSARRFSPQLRAILCHCPSATTATSLLAKVNPGEQLCPLQSAAAFGPQFNRLRAVFVCAEHVRQLEVESPSDNRMEVKS